MLKILSTKILNVLFPVKCIVCEKKDIVFCDECIEEHVHVQESSNSKIISIFNYKDKVIKDAIWKLKYTGNKKIGVIFGQVLHDKILEDISEQKIFSNFTNPLLVPIPLHKKRLRERGFNQSELTARVMSIIDAEESFSFAPNVLYKIKDTPSQAHIKDKNKRLKNLSGCFSVKDKSLVQGKNIILIDDITTTGATIHEATKTLRNAGANQVIAFTIAH